MTSSANTATPTLAVVGSFSFDSVIALDGRAITGKVGGNALWSSLGARAAGIAPRVLTVVGRGYPAHVLPSLADAGLDVEHVVRIDEAHPVRVTFAHLPGGGRLQPVPREMLAPFRPEVREQFVDTTTTPDVLRRGAPEGIHVPPGWLDEVDGWHLPLLPLMRHRSVVERLRSARGYLQSDCPARSDLIGDPYGRMQETASDIDVFLPSTSDVDVIDPGASSDDVVAHLRSVGSTVIVLKSGADGSLVVVGETAWRVPAFADEPIDPTGAGDAFCGGFLVGMMRSGDLVEAAALGSAVASFAVATEDPLDLISVDPAEVQRRAVHLRRRARRADRDDMRRALASAGGGSS